MQEVLLVGRELLVDPQLRLFVARVAVDEMDIVVYQPFTRNPHDHYTQYQVNFDFFWLKILKNLL